MSDNPYSHPAEVPVEAERKRAPLCAVMFWVSTLFCAVALGIAANGAYQYWYYTAQMRIPLNASILAESVCVACSGLGFLYSAISWRRRSILAAAVAMIGSLLAFFVGPALI